MFEHVVARLRFLLGIKPMHRPGSTSIAAPPSVGKELHLTGITPNVAGENKSLAPGYASWMLPGRISGHLSDFSRRPFHEGNRVARQSTPIQSDADHAWRPELVKECSMADDLSGRERDASRSPVTGKSPSTSLSIVVNGISVRRFFFPPRPDLLDRALAWPGSGRVRSPGVHRRRPADELDGIPSNGVIVEPPTRRLRLRVGLALERLRDQSTPGISK